MAATTVAEGVVIVSADASNVPKDIARDVDKGSEEMKSTGSRAGSRLFSGIGKFALGTVATVAGIGTAVGGLALKGGFDRALSIQDATKKLEGLGHDTKAISSIMSSALNSVRGTAFGLGAAATTSASLVAAGVDLGDELERRLKTVADTATIAGRSMEDVGTIFGSVAAKGKLQGDDLLQLMSSGVPVLQFLAEHLGKTSEEISEMVSRGEIDFATFADAMEEGIGGAALKGGETARGAFSNVMASLSRLGEGFAAPIVAAAPGLFTSIARAVDEVAAALGPVSDAFEAWLTPAVERLSTWIDETDWTKLTEGLLAFSPLATVAKAIEPLLPMLQTLGEDLWPVISDALVELGEALAPVLPMLSEALIDAFVQLAPPVVELVEALVPLIPSLVTLAVEALPPLVDLLLLIVPPLSEFVGFLADLIEPLDEMISFLTGETGLEDLAKHIEDSNGPLGDFYEWVGQLGRDFAPIFVGIMTVVGIVAGFLESAFKTVGDSFTWLGENVFGPIGTMIGDSFRRLGDIITWLHVNIAQPIFNALGTAFKWVWTNVISPVARFINDTVRNIGRTFKDVFGGLASTVGNAFQGALNMAKGPINGLIGLVNNAIRGLNGLSVTIPDWVPVTGGQTWGLSLPTIPMLAKGGVTRTPGTVMVGERGPEFLNLPAGAQVTPLNRPDALPSSSGGAPFIGGDLHIHEAEDPLGSAERLRKMARMYGKRK